MIKPLLQAEWCSRFNRYKQLIVGFSGGLDSTVLLHVLASHPALRMKLVAVHINHGISPYATDWQKHCQEFCRNLNIAFITQLVEFDPCANLEERARIARYAAFSSLMRAEDCLILGHHMDDQAETVLLQLCRGAGLDGLAAMAEISSLGLGTIARPFLKHSRKELEYYAVLHQLSWVDDQSNHDLSYSRNYVRQQIMPLLKAKWPGVTASIARSASHSQQARNNLEALAFKDCQELLNPKKSLFVQPLLGLNEARLANVLRVWLKKNRVQLPSARTFSRLLHELIVARPDALPEVAWGEFLVRRYQQRLYVDRNHATLLPPYLEWSGFPSPLMLGDKGINLLAQRSKQGLMIPQRAQISVRLRQGGEKFVWHKQNKELKKLFQEWEIPPWLRNSIPLVYINEDLAAVVDYAVSDLFFTRDPAQAWLLRTSY